MIAFVCLLLSLVCLWSVFRINKLETRMNTMAATAKELCDYLRE